jgi:hypothetical protein
MNRPAGVLSLSLTMACLLPTAPACYVEKPERVVDAQLGYSVSFPGRPTRSRYTEQTPFGQIEWFVASYTSGSRFDQIFSVDVGTLPPGDVGGTFEDEILATMKEEMARRFPGPAFDLDPESGPGFEYASRSATRAIRGIVVLRRGRFHHAKGVSQNADDLRLIKFLKSFQVD